MTLREQCEAFVREHRYGMSACFTSLELQIKALEAFARQQQAVGLSEVLERINGLAHSGAMLGGKQAYENCLQIMAICEQQAREREGTP